MKPFDTAITSGSVINSVWRLAWPMTLLSLVNGLHALVDHLLVGNFVPSEANEANAAIGIAWQLFLVMVVFMASLFHGMNVLVARYAGRQEREILSRIVYNTLLTSVFALGLVAAPLGYFLSPYLLDWFNATEGVQAHALPYMRILFTGSVPLFMMFLLTGAFQASGDPKTPLFLGILTTIINIAASFVLIVFVGLGTVGAALGTCLAPLAALTIALRLIVRGKLIVQLPERTMLKPDFTIIRRVMRIGIPTGIQAVIVNIGGALLIGIIGSLEHSAAAQAAYAICYTQLFAFVMWISFGLRGAAATMIGQNIGARKIDRGKKGVYVAGLMGLVWAGTIGVVFWTAPHGLLAMFDATDEPIASYGASLLRFLGLSGLAFSFAMSLTGGLQGTGDTTSPMVIAVISQIGVLLGLCFLADRSGYLSTNTIWAAILVSHIVRLLLSYMVFRRGRWARIRVELDQP